jgi:hypothetical protein
VEADGDGLSVGDSVVVMEGDGVVDEDVLSLGVSVGVAERDPVKVAVRVVLGVVEGLVLADALAVAEGDALAVPVAVAEVLAVAVGDGEGYTAHSAEEVVASLHTLTCKRPGALTQEARRAVVEELHGYGQVATQYEPALAAPATMSSTTCHQTSL